MCEKLFFPNDNVTGITICILNVYDLSRVIYSNFSRYAHLVFKRRHILILFICRLSLSKFFSLIVALSFSYHRVLYPIEIYVTIRNFSIDLASLLNDLTSYKREINCIV